MTNGVLTVTINLQDYKESLNRVDQKFRPLFETERMKKYLDSQLLRRCFGPLLLLFRNLQKDIAKAQKFISEAIGSQVTLDVDFDAWAKDEGTKLPSPCFEYSEVTSFQTSWLSTTIFAINY